MSYMQVKNLPSPHGNCEPSEDYVQWKCLADCEANYVIGKCNCKDIHMPGERTTCIEHNRFTNLPSTRVLSADGFCFSASRCWSVCPSWLQI